MLCHRPAHVSPEVLRAEIRRDRQKRVARVQGAVADRVEHCPVKFVGSWLCKNLDPPESELVEFGRKRILVDSNLANRLLGREPSSGKAVDVDLATPRAG